MNFGFLIFPFVEELDFIGPWEMVGMWSKYFDGPKNYFLVSQVAEMIQCAKGLKVIADYDFMKCPALDYLLIPGGQGTWQEVENQTLLDFVRSRTAKCQHVLSVCTGAFILQAAGLLLEKRVTTHWRALNRLRQRLGEQVIEERIVRDGNVWSAAGVSAGIDLVLALIADLAGEEVAGQVQMAAEYYPSHMRYGQAHLATEAPAYLCVSRR